MLSDRYESAQNSTDATEMYIASWSALDSLRDEEKMSFLRGTTRVPDMSASGSKFADGTQQSLIDGRTEGQ